MIDSPGARFDRLVDVMRTLRGPDGCPWDREQTLSSLRPFVLEETYELLDALDRGDLEALREELGDFLFEAVFLARIAEDAGHFSIGDAVQSVTNKLVRRHPHVFTPDGQPLSEAREAITADAVVRKWEDIKAGERHAAGAAEKTILSGVPKTLPALLRAYELSSRAAAVGFDWPAPDDVVAKIEEEVAELREAVHREAGSAERAQEEMGDLLFTIVNLARKLGVEPEAALRIANQKFQARFEGIEATAKRAGRSLKDMSLDEMESLWTMQKQSEPRKQSEVVEGNEGAEEDSKVAKGTKSA
jgi:MazG family protein